MFPSVWSGRGGSGVIGNALNAVTKVASGSVARMHGSCDLNCSSCGDTSPPKRHVEERAFATADEYPPPPTFSSSSWTVEHERHHNLPKVNDILNEKEIVSSLEKTKEAAKDIRRVREILKKAWDNALLKGVQSQDSEFVQGLTVEEAATLLNVDENNRPIMEELFSTALKIKERIYGNRIVLFAPVYLSNYCDCTCLYCGYRGSNREVDRSSLTNKEVVEEVKKLQKMGHRRLLLLTGESPKYTFEQFLDALRVTDSVKTPPHGRIRRINIEVPPLSISDVRRVKETGVVGTNTVFQETYHRPTYKKMHPSGPKSHFQHRLQTMDRSQIGGIDDCGIGALFGLYDYRYEVLGMLQHAKHLDKTYGAGPHTISIPRIQPALNAPASAKSQYTVSDLQFKKLVAILRCAVPYTGMILSTREDAQTRRAICRLGVSQMSAGSRTEVGAYSEEDKKEIEQSSSVGHGQFTLSDDRNLDEVIYDLMGDGFMPSFCTACYRVGRTGRTFMNIAKRGDIANLCGPNAVMTLAEYLVDYASPRTRERGWKVVESEKKGLSRAARKMLDRNLEKIKNQDVRDIYV